MTTDRFQRGFAKMMEYQAQDNPDVSSHTKLIEFYQDLAPDLPNLIVEFHANFIAMNFCTDCTP